MFSNTVNAISSAGGLLATSLVDVSKGKSVRRVIVDATKTLELKIANATSTENSPAGSRRSLVRVDLNHVVTDSTGKVATLVTSAYVVLVQPVAETDSAISKQVTMSLFTFLLNGDNQTNTLSSEVTTNVILAPAMHAYGDTSTDGNVLARVIRGEL